MFGKKAKLLKENIENNIQHSNFVSPNLLNLFSNRYYNDLYYNNHHLRKRKFIYENVDVNNITASKEKEYEQYDKQTIDLIHKTFLINDNDKEKGTLKMKYFENDECIDEDEEKVKLTKRFRQTMRDIMSKKVKNNLNISSINPINDVFNNYNKDKELNPKNVKVVIEKLIPENNNNNGTDIIETTREEVLKNENENNNNVEYLDSNDIPMTESSHCNEQTNQSVIQETISQTQFIKNEETKEENINTQHVTQKNEINIKSSRNTQEKTQNIPQSINTTSDLNLIIDANKEIEVPLIIPKIYHSHQLEISEHIINVSLFNQARINEEILTIQSSITNLQNIILNQQSLVSNLQSEYEQLNSNETLLYNSLSIFETHRKRAQEYIHSLKGNLRVYCRVKPPSNPNDSFITYPEISKLSSSTPSSSEANNNISIMEIKNTQSNQTFAFTFDRVFTENSTQIEIFSEIKQFIQSALDGDNICIFAYGATGSGKTFTMQGYSNLPKTGNSSNQIIIQETSGILPRCAEFIFSEKRRLVTQKEDINISLAAMEIYNENLFDLLSSINEPLSPIKNLKRKSNIRRTEKVPLTIYSAGNEVNIPNLKWADILSESDIIKYTNLASESRRSDSTAYNATSSRSHAIFQIKIQHLTKKKTSMINIIDLAGSERSQITSFDKMTKDEIEAKKRIQNEANFINKSLSALGRIINLIGDKKTNSTKISIPYRDSKLTIVLQNYLKPNAKTVMIVNVACEGKNYNYTKESLNFAANAMVNC